MKSMKENERHGKRCQDADRNTIRTTGPTTTTSNPKSFIQTTSKKNPFKQFEDCKPKSRTTGKRKEHVEERGREIPWRGMDQQRRKPRGTS